MRILYLADAVFPDMPGGSKRVAWHLAHSLARRGHEPTFLVPAQGAGVPGEELHEGVRIVRYPLHRDPLRFVQAGREACRRLWARGEFDIIHTHFAYTGVGPLQVVPASVPRIRTFYGFWDQEGWVQETRSGASLTARGAALLKRAVRARIEAASLKHSAAIVALSDYSVRDLRSRGTLPERIRVIPPGVDASRFMLCDDIPGLRKRLGLPAERRVLLSVRRLVPRMGLDSLINAMPAVAACHPDALLLIGGDGPERARLEGLIANLGLDNHVRLLGFIPDDLLASYYQSADVFVLPTAALEGFGLVTLEALACGTPVIGTPVGATPELLGRLDPKLLSDDTSPRALASSVCRFLTADAAAQFPRAKLHEFARGSFDWDIRAGKVQDVYEEVSHVPSQNQTSVIADRQEFC